MRSLILTALLFAGCRSKTPIAIQAEPSAWSPSMNSTPGIRLGSDADEPLLWTTGFGEFIRWDPPGHEIRRLGQTAVAKPGDAIYWTYDPRQAGQTRPQVMIAASGRRRAGAILLDWDGDTAKVSR